MRKVVFFLSVTLALLLMSNLVSASAEKDTIKIGLATYLSGAGSVEGSRAKIAAEIAQKEINDKGGVLGKKIEVISGDTESDPSKGLAAAKKLISQDRVVALIAGSNTPVGTSIKGLASREKVSVIEVHAVGDALTAKRDEWYFRIGDHAAMRAAAVPVVIKELAIKKVSIIATDNSYGRDQAKLMADPVKQMGGQVVSTDFFSQDATDLYPILTKIKNMDSDTLFIGTMDQNGALVAKQARELGLKQRMVGSAGLASYDFIRLAGPASEGVYSMTLYTPTIDNPQNKTFVKAFKEAAGLLPTKTAAPAYEAVYLIVDAMKRANSTEHQAVRDALEKADFDTIGGRIKFNEVHQALRNLYLVVVDKGELVTKAELRIVK